MLGLMVLARGASADGVDIVKVEEDWELVVLEPDSPTVAPQVTCMMSPNGTESGLHMTFEVNHKSGAQFVQGGLTMQLWNDESWVSTKRSESNAAMSAVGETVTWTQSMRVFGDELIFKVKNGNSTTWGAFGGNSFYRLSSEWHGHNLNDYTPDSSVHLSGIGFASNRVQSLVLKRVRVYAVTGEVYEDATPRTVFQHQ